MGNITLPTISDNGEEEKVDNCPPCPPCPYGDDQEPTIPSTDEIQVNVEVEEEPKASNDASAAPTDAQHMMLKWTNVVRESAGLEPVELDPKLAALAKDWNIYLKHKNGCAIRHPIDSEEEKQKYIPNNIGQNLYVSHGHNPDGTRAGSPEDAVGQWYSECQMYDPQAMNSDGIPTNFKDIGHFTQLMWKDTKKMGCNEIQCPINDPSGSGKMMPGSIITCNYDKGNIAGQFTEQVVYDKNKCPYSKIAG